jgi:hypothetical protein
MVGIGAVVTIVLFDEVDCCPFFGDFLGDFLGDFFGDFLGDDAAAAGFFFGLALDFDIEVDGDDGTALLSFDDEVVEEATEPLATDDDDDDDDDDDANDGDDEEET